MNNTAIILGAGSHALLILRILKEHSSLSNFSYVNNNPSKIMNDFNCKYIGTDKELSVNIKKRSVELFNGIGTRRDCLKRNEVFTHFKKLGFKFGKLVHPSAYVCKSVYVPEGSQILLRAMVNSGTIIGENCIINTSAILEHDSLIGSGCHIGPSSVVCGSAKVSDDTLVGANCVVLPGSNIKNHKVLKAGGVYGK